MLTRILSLFATAVIYVPNKLNSRYGLIHCLNAQNSTKYQTILCGHRSLI